MTIALAGCGTNHVAASSLPSLPDTTTEGTTGTTTTLPPSPPTTSLTIKTTPVLPKVIHGAVGQTIAINNYSIKVVSVSSSSCSGSAPPGTGYLFVGVVVKTISGNTPPNVGALAFNLTDDQGQMIGESWYPAPCEPPGPPGGFISRFKVPGNATGLEMWWNPGDTTGRQVAIPLGG